MSFIGMGIYSILRKCGLGFIPSGILGGCILLLYTLMIGAGVSSIRALIMFLVRIGADMTGRDYDLPTSLALSAAGLVWKEPLYLTDAGFQLSFGAILGMSLLGPVFSETFGCDVFASKKKAAQRKKLPAQYGWSVASWTARGLSSSMAVSAFLMGPLLYFYFEVPPYSVILNLLVIPIMPAAMGAGLAGSLLAFVWDPAGGAVLQVCRGVLWIYDLACAGAGMIPGSRIVTGQPEMMWLIVYYLGIGVICIIFRYLLERKASLAEFREGHRDSVKDCQSSQSRQGCARGLSVRLPGLLLLLFAAGMTVSCRMGYKPSGEMQAVLLDVGQGDGIHIRGPAGNYFIDGGSSDVSQPGTYRIEPYLLANGVDIIDYAFVTHGDEDHISGIRELLVGQEMGIRIRCLVLPPQEYHDEKLTELAVLAARNGTRAAVMEAGDVIRQEGVTFTCIGPERDAGLEPGNGASLVLDVSFGEFDMLLTGDVEGAGEKSLIESGRLREYDVLKAAHHGSKNSGAEDFLEIIHPTIALISAGRDNRYGHPHRETLERLAYAGCRVYSTQESGAVTVWTDGSKVRCNSYLAH